MAVLVIKQFFSHWLFPFLRVPGGHWSAPKGVVQYVDATLWGWRWHLGPLGRFMRGQQLSFENLAAGIGRQLVHENIALGPLVWRKIVALLAKGVQIFRRQTGVGDNHVGGDHLSPFFVGQSKYRGLLNAGMGVKK